MGDLPRRGHPRHPHELDPLDMSDDGASHNSAPCHVSTMMGAVKEQIPPFERFYLAHRDEVLGYLRRLLGQRAEDAWQETFLRALRAYDRLEHGRHLRAWVFTIATNVAFDELRAQARARRPRRARAGAATRCLPRAGASDRRPAAKRTRRSGAPLRLRPALRGDRHALGSSEEAARAAASSGVRRLRRSTMNVPSDLDARFRAAALADRPG